MMKSYFILSMCFLFLVQYFVHSAWLQYALALAATIAFGASIAWAKPIPRLFSILMFAAGAILTYSKGQGMQALAQGVTTNLPLLTLLVLVPLLSIPLKLGGFLDSILAYLQRYKHQPRKMFAGMTAVLFFLGPILNIGSIRIIDELIKDLRLNSTLLSKAYLVGFSTTILWSPYYAAVGLTLLYLHVAVTDYMLYGFGIAVLFLVVGNVLFGIWSGRQQLHSEEAPGEAAPPTPKDRTKVRLLAWMLVALMGIIIAAESITHWSILVLVSLLALLFPLCWGLFSRQWTALRRQVADYREKAVPVMNNEIIMYISAGFFGQSLQGTSLGQGINVLMTNLAQISFLLFALFVLVVMVCVTFVGIHQVVVVTVLATQMDPVLLGTTKEMLAMVIMLAWSASSILSPVNPVNLLVSSLVKKSSIEVGIRDNGAYVLVVSALGILLLTWIH